MSWYHRTRTNPHFRSAKLIQTTPLRHFHGVTIQVPGRPAMNPVPKSLPAYLPPDSGEVLENLGLRPVLVAVAPEGLTVEDLADVGFRRHRVGDPVGAATENHLIRRFSRCCHTNCFSSGTFSCRTCEARSTRASSPRSWNER